MSYKNLALGYVVTPPSPATSGTSLVLGSGEGARFPAPVTDGVFYCTVCPADDDPHLGNSEIIKVTARTTDTFGTIVRAQRGSSARSIVAGDRVFLGIYIEDLQMGSAPVIGETPSGSVNSSNKSFTTALTFVANSLQVFLNGIRLTRGTDYAEKSDLSGFDIDASVTAPQTGDILRVNYHISPQTLVTGSNAFVIETVPGTPNGSTTAFTLSNTPVGGSLEIFRDGQLLEGGGADYTLSGAVVTFVNAPATGSLLKAKYQQSVSTSGNADTVDGLHGIDGQTEGMLVPWYGGWTKANETWAYSSVSGIIGVITVPTGAASRYQKGDRIRFKQGGSYKYFVVVAVTDTTLSITGGTDYTLTNAGITDNYYSHDDNPIGYPTLFNWSPTFTGFSANPTNTIHQFRINGNVCNLIIRHGSAGTSNSSSFTLSLPVTAVTLTNAVWLYPCQIQDNSTVGNNPGQAYAVSAGTVLNFLKDFSGTGFTSSGGKSCPSLTFFYQI